MRTLLVSIFVLTATAAAAQEPPPPLDPAEGDAVDENKAEDEDKVEDEDEDTGDAASDAPVDPDDAPAPPAENPPAPPPPGGDMVNLGVDRELDERMERCYELIAARQTERAVECLDEVARSERTTAGLVARGVRRAYGLQLDLGTSPAEDPAAQAKLWLGVTGGVFGLQHGISLGSLLTLNSGLFNIPALAVLVWGGLIVGGAAGYGLLGAWAAEEYGLTVEDAHLLFAGGFWGGALGAQLSGLIALNLANNGIFDTTGATVTLPQLFGALIGGTSALVFQRGQMGHGTISLMNSGGLVGAGLMGVILLNVAPYAIPDANIAIGSLMVGQALGLVGGALLGQAFDFTWGEALLIDLGGVLGFVSTGTLILAAGFAGLLPNSPITAHVVSVVLTAGTLGGAATAGYLIQDGRKEKRGAAKSAGRPPVLAPTVLLDRNQAAAPGMAVGFTF